MRLERGRHLGARIPLLDQPPPGRAQSRARRRVAHEPRERRGECLGVAGGHEHRVLVIGQHLGHDPHARRDERAPRGQVLEDHA